MLDEVNRLRHEYCIDLKQKTTDKAAWRRGMFDEMMEQLDTWADLRVPKLKFPKLRWDEADVHHARYNDYFQVGKKLGAWKAKAMAGGGDQ